MEDHHVAHAGDDSMLLAQLGVVMMLLLLSYQDIKQKKVSVAGLITAFIFAGIIVFIRAVNGELLIQNAILGILPGVILFLFSVLDGRVIGKADGIVLVILGMSLNGDELLIAWFFIAGGLFIISAICFITLKARDSLIAFVPIVFVGTVAGLCEGILL